jgi:type I restriction enzyme R subunit
MTTDTTERGLERLICFALTGHPCDPPKAGTVGEPAAAYGGVGWSCGNAHDYDRECCVDLVQLSAFLHATHPRLSHDALTPPGAPATNLPNPIPPNRSSPSWMAI